MATNSDFDSTVLPSLTLEQVRQRLVALLNEAGNLSAYIESVDEGMVVIKNFTVPVPTACTTKPRQLVVGQPVPDFRLQRVADAIQSINEDFETGQPLRLKLSNMRAACLDADEREIAVRS